jgi:hypothetical protein
MRHNPPGCECTADYWTNPNTFECELCNFRCIECSSNSYNDTPNCKADKCAANRTVAPHCPCPSNYFEPSDANDT